MSPQVSTAPCEWHISPATCPRCTAFLHVRFKPGTKQHDRFSCENCGRFDNLVDNPVLETPPHAQDA